MVVEIKRAVRQTPSWDCPVVDDNIFQQTSAATVGTASRVSTLLLDRESEGIRIPDESLHCNVYHVFLLAVQHKEVG